MCHPKPILLCVLMAFSGSVYAADWHSQASALCRALPASSSVDYALPVAQKSGLPKSEENATRISADHIDGQIKGIHRATGQVIVERNQDVLNADWVEYREEDDSVQAGDAFVLTREDGQTITGNQLSYQLGKQAGQASDAAFVIEQNNRRLQGVSSQLLMQNKQQHILRDVQFNTCATGDKSWYIQADEVRTNQATGIGVAKNAKFVFAGVPLLYTPWADFPLNGNRKSGLLVPTLKIGSDGTEVDVPYYFNLAPNYDATARLGVISARGVRVGSEFRYLDENFSGSLDGTYMPDDARSPHNNRYEINAQHSHRFTDALSAGLDIHQVSDDDYYRDFYGRDAIAENVNLNRSLWFDYQKKVFGQPLNAQLLLQKYQTLDDSLGNKNEPYAILPRLSATWQKNFHSFGQFNLQSQLTRFAHSSKQDGTRAVIYPSLQWDLHNNWGYIRPKIGVHATQYWLGNFNGQHARNASRVLPILNIDSGITFERPTQLFGSSYWQTLEPRLFYNYIPKKAQNHLPNFDTSENDFNYEQLFRENIYSGSDRINASNSISLGFQSRLLNPQTGVERFRAGIGQKFYLNSDNVTFDGNLYSNNRNRSDVIAFAGGWLNNNWYADSHLHWNQSDERMQRYDLGVRYNPQAGKVLSARFKYGHNEEIYTGFYGKLKHIDLAAQWPISANLYAIARLNYSISPWRALEQTIGLEYRNPCGCWSTSLVAQRYVTDLNKHKTGIFVTFQLKDLSNVGNNRLTDKLRLAIPGYVKTNEVIQK